MVTNQRWAKAGFEHGVEAAVVAVEPVEEGVHFTVELRGGRRLVVDALPADRAGDDLHGACASIAPGADRDLFHAAAAGGKERGVPAEQAFGGQRLVVFLGRVEHHLDNAFHIAVGRRQGADIACRGGARARSVPDPCREFRLRSRST